MVKKKGATIISILLICLLAMAGSSALVISLVKAKETSGEEKQTVSIETFSAWTDVEEFQTIPSMSGENIKISEADDYGEGNYLIDVDGATKEEYFALSQLWTD